MMKIRPILFNGDMVRAILNGSKKQTRRLVEIPDWVKGDPADYDTADECNEATTIEWLDKGHFADQPSFAAYMTDYPEEGCVPITCPYGVAGDQLWGRENWRAGFLDEKTKPRDILPSAPIHYEADGKPSEYCGFGKLRPSIFMPRWASRITLQITNVRVERLNDISKDDVIAEGCYAGSEQPANTQSAINTYRSLWESINGDGSWAANPWVWVVEFEVVCP